MKYLLLDQRPVPLAQRTDVHKAMVDWLSEWFAQRLDEEMTMKGKGKGGKGKGGGGKKGC